MSYNKKGPSKTYYCVICSSSKFIKHKLNLKSFDIVFCNKCHIGMTLPVPQNLSNYYHDNYWVSSGIAGLIKQKIFMIFQKRRKKWITKYLNSKVNRILDVGCGEGIFSKSLDKNFEVINLDTPFANIKNMEVLKVNFLEWKTNRKFDAIVFWESLEHMDKPLEYIIKAKSLLEPKGFLFIEYPRFDSWERIFSGKFWYHLDLPRHLVHFTEIGLKKLLEKNSFSVKDSHRVTAPEYTILGTTVTVLNFFGIQLTDRTKKGGLFLIILLFPLIVISLLVQLFFSIFNQSIIGIIVAKKI